jgi:hypothetical protein
MCHWRPMGDSEDWRTERKFLRWTRCGMCSGSANSWSAAASDDRREDDFRLESALSSRRENSGLRGSVPGVPRGEMARD